MYTRAITVLTKVAHQQFLESFSYYKKVYNPIILSLKIIIIFSNPFKGSV